MIFMSVDVLGEELEKCLHFCLKIAIAVEIPLTAERINF